MNGHRVVLAEIESVARSTADIDAAMVEVATMESALTLRLFVRPSKGSAITEADVRENLRSQHPTAAVPARIIVTSELSMNSNVKPQLPVMPADPAGAPGPGVAPAITALPESILGRPLHAADNLFGVGFTSITLLRFNAELNGLLQQEIPAVRMFRYPSLRRLLLQLGVQAPAPTAPVRTCAQPEAGTGGVRDRRRQLWESIARQLGDSQR